MVVIATLPFMKAYNDDNNGDDDNDRDGAADDDCDLSPDTGV